MQNTTEDKPTNVSVAVHNLIELKYKKIVLLHNNTNGLFLYNYSRHGYRKYVGSYSTGDKSPYLARKNCSLCILVLTVYDR